MTNTVIVLAAGRGSRFGGRKSKLLMEIDGYTIIERLISTLVEVDMKRIFVVVGYDYKKVIETLEDYPVAYIYNPFYRKYGQMYSFSLAKKYISHNTLLMDGDLVVSENDLKKIIYSPFSAILVDKNKPTEKDMGVIRKKDELFKLAYGEGENVWMSICKLTGGVFKAFGRIDYKNDISQSDVLNFVSQYNPIRLIYGESFWKNINTKRDYELTKKVLE